MSRRASLISQQNSVTDDSALLVSNLFHIICFFGELQYVKFVVTYRSCQCLTKL